MAAGTRLRTALGGAAVVAACVAGGVVGPVSGSAHGTEPSAPAASQRPHVTKAAYDKVRHGWKITRVHHVFGIEGRKVVQGGGYATRVYDGWTNCLRIDVVYHHVNGAWRLDTKKTWTDTDCVP